MHFDSNLMHFEEIVLLDII